MIEIALSSWSLHAEFLNPHISQLNAEKFPRLARDTFGVEFIEFYEGDYAADFLSPDVDLAYARRIREACDDVGVKVVCVAAVNDLTSDDESSVERDSLRLAKWVKHCTVLGCPVIRINSGHRPLTAERAAVLKERLLRIAQQHANDPVVFAVENHPHSLRRKEDTELLRSVISDIGLRNVRACPDVGAMARGYWQEGLTSLAPLAAHVHLKPMVFNADGSQLPISQYAPSVKEILTVSGFKGAVSFEFTEYRDINANPYEDISRGLQGLFAAFDRTPPRPQVGLTPPTSHIAQLKVNEDIELTPARQILQLLADGCESNLRRQIRIHDFATYLDIYSIGASRDPDAMSARANKGNFCALVELHEVTCAHCHHFITGKLDHVRRNIQVRPQLSICPLGLIELSVPVRDDEFLYAVISCFAWIEEGTEGMTIESIESHTQPDTPMRKAFEKAFLSIAAFSPQKLQESSGLLERLSGDLAELYKSRREERMRLQQGADVISEVRRLSERQASGEPVTVESFLDALPEQFQRFLNVAGVGGVALYTRTPMETVDPAVPTRYERRIPSRESHLPFSLDLETGASNVVAADRSALVREQMLIALQGMAGVVHRVFPRSFDPTEVIVFAAPTGTTLNSHTERQLTQFVEEILQILAHLHHLAELEERERRLEIFIGHAKHSLSRPVGLILDRLRWITRANRTVEETRTRLSTMLLSAEDAARIIQRFTSRVRVAGKAQLRRQYHFVQAAPGYILEQTASQLRTTGRPRQIEFRGYDSLPQTTAVCDARALTELFENLIDNAVKYAQGGYPVFYEGRECNPETDEDWGLPSPGLRFVIKDFGLGIPEEDLERIFLPYVQSQVEDINRVIPGTGLGLAICRDIVQAHNGRIWAECDIPGPNRNLPSPVRYSGCWVKFIVELPNRPENQESV